MVMIGKVPPETSCSDIEERLKSLPLSQEDAVPVENCVTWTKFAIQALQTANLAELFDLDAFMDYALEYADRRLKNPEGLADTMNYTRRRM